MAADSLVLLSTEHCSLCEQALDALLSMPELRGHALQVVDVADDDVLLARYGEHLPVLRYRGATLYWPFTRSELARLLNPDPGSPP